MKKLVKMLKMFEGDCVMFKKFEGALGLDVMFEVMMLGFEVMMQLIWLGGGGFGGRMLGKSS